MLIDTPLIWSTRCTRLLSVTCLKHLMKVRLQMILTPSLRILTLMFKFSFFFLCFLWETYRDCFHDFSFSLQFFLRFLTWSRDRHSQPVTMESLQFVGCSWFIGLIGLGFRFTQNKSTETEQCAHPRPFPVSSTTHLDAPGVHSLAGYEPLAHT
jgi:hypothetical protein